MAHTNNPQQRIAGTMSINMQQMKHAVEEAGSDANAERQEDRVALLVHAFHGLDDGPVRAPQRQSSAHHGDAGGHRNAAQVGHEGDDCAHIVASCQKLVRVLRDMEFHKRSDCKTSEDSCLGADGVEIRLVELELFPF
eukprot:CAMPEP_0115187684 /NCGR_PEP_ID=MMETSP0270-20121206/10620_1 /TAXON_ID=71861 /ORGANISM="Scrippsiella trochoidea, Strain CCMP3099" /LENGTH=137 /DNA_ID=CAMNT_0002600839 /DNA_START=219 /DNA_END=631 /DNA_ORIENTATION=+